MTKLNLKSYFETGGASFSLINDDARYVSHPDLNAQDLSWYRYFTSVKARTIKLPSDVLALDRHGRDCASFARFCLADGGDLVIPAGDLADDAKVALIDGLSALGLAVRLEPGMVHAYRVGAIVPVDRRAAPVYVVGDSHVRFLAGRNEISGARQLESGIKWYDDLVYDLIGVHLGAGLAHSLGRYGSTTLATEKIERLLDRGAIPAGASIMLSFGEVDCRSHVVRQAEKQGTTIEQVATEIADSVIAYMEKLSARGYEMQCWGAPAPSWAAQNADPRYPISGSFEQRKLATRTYNDRLAAQCAVRGFGFLSIEPRLYDETGLTDRRFYCDMVHLSQSARPLLWDALDAQAGDAPPSA